MNYYIKTFGCQMNFSDSERIAAFLESHNFKPAKNIEQADLIIFNTCGVRQTAEDRVYGQVHNLRKNESRILHHESKKKKVILITGCLAHRKDVQRKLESKVNMFITINDFFKNYNIENYFKIKNFKLKIPAQKNNVYLKNGYLSIKPKCCNKINALVPIMTGCNNFCSYCVVPYARGREYSRPPEDIFNEVENLFKNGYEEITLLGQNVNSYNYRIKNYESRIRKQFNNLTIKQFSKISFPLLLNILASSFPKIFWRFLTSHPKDFSDELINVIAKNKNISREIHLPVQSGSNKILKMMNRPYTQKKYLDLITKIKKEIPQVKFSTDAIVGFPEETEKDFQKTAEVFKRVGYFEAYINKYSPRPETTAFKLGDPIPWEEKKIREKKLRKLIKK